jgi:hypothetical protein
MAYASSVRVSDHDVMSELFRRIVQILITILLFVVPFALLVSVICTQTVSEFLYECISSASSETYSIIESFSAITASIMKAFTIY